MEELITIHLDKKTHQQVVSARELHGFLKVQSRFNDWMNNRIKQYGLIDGQDYTSFTKILVKGGQAVEYALTLSTAKELAMVENNEQGKVARLYFIEMERRAKDPVAHLTRKDLAMMLVAAENERESVEQQLRLAEQTINRQVPKVEYHDRVLQSDGLIAVTQIAADLGISAMMLNKWLHDNSYQFKINGSWVPAAKIKNKDFMRSKTFPYMSETGELKTKLHFYFTEKGRQAIMEEYTAQLQKRREAVV
jgi:anti-repressor protein